MSGNEPFHPFFADEFFEGEPMTPREKRIAQFYTHDGIRIGREQGIRMLNDYLNTLHSVIGEAVILEIREKLKKIDEG